MSLPRHPLGEAHLERLLAMARLHPPCRILDMGAGGGASLRRLSELGFDARGIDKTGAQGVDAGDFLRCPYASGSFDAILSECAFFASGDTRAALLEAARLLRAGGLLLLGDLCFMREAQWRAELQAAGFVLLCIEDVSEAWKRYYIECLWDGTAEAPPCETPKKGGRYFLTVCERQATNGRF